MKRMCSIILLVLTSLTLQAQTIEYAKSVGPFVARPEVRTDKKTNKTKAAWQHVNYEYIKDYCGPLDFTVEENYGSLFPVNHMPIDEQPNMPMSWRLTGEGDETVLHCYFHMPADEVTNLWLTGEEACIVDRETGVQYRIRRTEPDTYGKHFDIKAKKGDVIDLKIIFPPLPDTTRMVNIYGVVNWGLLGEPVVLNSRFYGQSGNLDYDTIPQLHKPRLLLEHMYDDLPYDRQNWNTWKVMTDAHLIKPVADNTMALWLTPEATYMAIGYEQNFATEYFEFMKDTKLVDVTGRQYKLREVQGIPKDELFFMKGQTGDYIAFMMVFDPIPLDMTTITFIVPSGEPFSAWGANWAGRVFPNLNILQLRDNQRLFNYQPRIIVE